MAILRVGTGSDGNVEISANKNINVDTISSGRTYADGVYYRVSNISTNYVDVSTTPNGITAGDEVVLINTGGRPSNYENAGNYELFTVDSINSNSITFTQPIQKLYGDNGGNANLADHPVMIQRVPNYNNMTINNAAVLSCDDISARANNAIGGLIIFKVKETLDIIDGTINANHSGFRGHYPQRGSTTYAYGEGRGVGIWGGSNTGGGAGHVEPGGERSGGGGNGPAYSILTPDLERLRHGSGGGDAKMTTASYAGGDGGGTIFIVANALNISTGGISVTGQSATFQPTGPEAGSGSGGSLLIHASSVSIPNEALNAEGGVGFGAENTGAGSIGAIAIHYLSGSIGTVSPTPYTETISMPYKISGTVAGRNAQFIRIYDPISGELLNTYSGINIGSYEIDAPGPGPYDVIARSSEGKIIGFGGVTPVET